MSNVMIIAEIAVKCLLITLALPAGYLLLCTVAAYLFRKEAVAENRFLHIGVLVPAHNEEDGIVHTIEGVLACDYPNNLLNVYVIADNCSDQTAEKARQAGALVFERFDNVNRGKGQALDWFLKNHLDIYRHTEVITIIDADVSPDKNFLREISASLSNSKIQVVQAFNSVSNPDAGWRPALSDAAFNVFCHLRMAGSVMLSGTAVLKGNGMAFKTELLKRYGWPCHSVVEDMEFTLQLLVDGITVSYNPDAVIRSEMVTSGKSATSQRNRWEGGRFMLVRRMTMPLLKLFSKTGNTRYLYALAELATPPLSLLVMLFSLATACTFLLLKGAWLILAASFWLILIFYVISGQIQRRAPLSTWLYLAAAPLYILWKIPLYAAMLLKKKGTAWVRTERESTRQR
ncbi:MAG: glycosyltransferase family 2 protein [Chlorobiales bacterium]|nr:glycosyltransferase family 2 protein [Chlorobiales bacterium]